MDYLIFIFRNFFLQISFDSRGRDSWSKNAIMLFNVHEDINVVSHHIFIFPLQRIGNYLVLPIISFVGILAFQVQWLRTPAPSPSPSSSPLGSRYFHGSTITAQGMRALNMIESTIEVMTVCLLHGHHASTSRNQCTYWQIIIFVNQYNFFEDGRTMI